MVITVGALPLPLEMCKTYIIAIKKTGIGKTILKNLYHQQYFNAFMRRLF